MPDKEKKNNIRPIINISQGNECPKKEEDNCLVPGVYSDSEPIGGG